MRRRAARSFAIAIALLGGAPRDAPAEDAPAARVLILSSGDATMPGTERMGRAIREAIDTHAQRPVEYFVETLDLLRTDGTGFESELFALLQAKLGERVPDVIVTIASEAAVFADRLRVDWGPVPIVVSAPEGPEHDLLPTLPRVIDVPLQIDLVGTLEFAARLQPALRRVVLIGGSSAFDRRWAGHARRQLAPVAGRWDLHWWTDRTQADLLRDVATLPADTAIVYLVMLRDAAGALFVPRDAASQIAVAASVPVYVTHDYFIGDGTLGGMTTDLDAQASAAGILAARLINGEPFESVRPAPAMAARAIVDWRQIERFGIDPARLPPGTEIRFREASLWQSHRTEAIAAISLVALQAALIGALLVQMRRRHAAERHAEQRRNELARGARLSTAGELVASIAHEVNQPLGAIRSNADTIDILLDREAPAVGQARQLLAHVRRDVMRASDVVRQVRTLVSHRAPARRRLDLNSVVADVMVLIGGDLRRRGIAAQTAFAADLPLVVADIGQMQQVLLNLALNAADAMASTPAERRRVVVSTAVMDGNGVEVAVADTGHGISEANAGRLFDSFFTTKPEGMGLGLSIARSIVEAHGGRIRAGGNADGGATLTFWLPAAPLAGGEGADRVAEDNA